MVFQKKVYLELFLIFVIGIISANEATGLLDKSSIQDVETPLKIEETMSGQTNHGNPILNGQVSNPYRSIGTWGDLPGNRGWGAVIGVSPDDEGNIWVFERCGSNTCLGSDLDPILKFDEDGNFLKSFGANMFAWPHGFYIDKDGNIWVTDASGRWLPDAEPWE